MQIQFQQLIIHNRVAIPNNLQGKTNLTNFTSVYNRNSANQLVMEVELISLVLAIS